MTEISIPLADLQNGQPADYVPIVGETLPRVDAVAGVFLTSKGGRIALSDRQVSALIIQRIQQQGKPKIPLVEVTLMGKHKQMEAHPHDEGYLAQLAEWEEESNASLLRYLFNVGVKGQPPQEFLDEYRYYVPDASPQELKYLWVSSQLPDDDIGAFTEALIGQSEPTQKGLDEAADSFRGES